MLRCTGQQIILIFHDEYFNKKVFSEWFQTRVNKIENYNSPVTLREITKPVEEETDILVAKLAVLADQPAHKTQSLLRHTDDKVFIALLMRWSIVTEYFQKHDDQEFPHTDSLPQFIIDYLTNHWRWIKEQADS